ncbi:cupin domain-containing protein [Deinococcus rubellus]|uniref:helix-turn-helix domain-containing protein n=1 Tax=Deinococcus rubellus TaxID=1889240 RepID=UPI0031E6E1DE
MVLGTKIRSRRRRLSLTLHNVAEAADLSKPFLSQVERGHASPSLTSLSKIAHALGVSLQYFITVPTEKNTVKRAKNLRYFTLDGSKNQYASLTGDVPDRQLEALITRLPPATTLDKATQEVTTHAGEEVIYVLEGCLRITLDDQTFELETGDSAHYQASAHHTWENFGSVDTVLIWVGTPTLFDL